MVWRQSSHPLLQVVVVCCLTVVLCEVASAVKSDVTWSSDPEHLNVFVVPHSHNDPGWWWTYEEYYKKWSKGIISSVVAALDEDPSRTFIWCETSFFSRWWKDQNSATKQTVKRLVRDGQLEFVGGGWVMNDEASVTLQDVVNQYTAGHQWLRHHVGPEAVPTTAWSIDPFGHSSAMAWAHREMGMEGMVINRVHKDTKQSWNQEQLLEFSWERPWHMGNTSCVPGEAVPHLGSGGELSLSKAAGRGGERWEGDGMLTHMLAYKLYDIPNTCGPDWDVCAQFDFERPVAVPVTYKNVEERSLILVQQYRSKAEAFQHNNLLVPLGDDFKYKNIEITRKMMSQYQLLFDHINSNPDLKVSIRFATLSEYFEAVKHSMPKQALPTYDKDFFTYNDEGADYWSGYYTTRPYLKKLIRTTGTSMRSAQILYNIAHTSSEASPSISTAREEHYAAIEQCSQTLGLLQHHDAITGTCRQTVANDYTALLATSNAAVREVTAAAAGALLCSAPKSVRLEHVEVYQQGRNDEGEKELKISVAGGDDGFVITFFNPLAFSVQQMAQLTLNTPMVEVIDLSPEGEGRVVVSQASPLFVDGRPSASSYRIFFQVNVESFGFASYVIRHSVSELSRATMATVITNKSPTDQQRIGLLGETRAIVDQSSDLLLESPFYSISLDSSNGQPSSLLFRPDGRQGEEREILLEHRYKLYRSRSGAYLFKPTGEAAVVENTADYFIIKGPLVQEAVSVLQSRSLSLSTRVFCSPIPSVGMVIEMAHSLDISGKDYNNGELISELTTNVGSGGTYFTDGNGLDMIERNWEPSLPIQANFYPISSAVSMPGPKSQMTLLSRQGVGVGSLAEDCLQVMLDRRTMQDDGRGMGEKVTDNAKLEERFYLVFQDVSGGKSGKLFPRTSTPLIRKLQAQLEYPAEGLYATIREWSAGGCTVAPLTLASGRELQEDIDIFSFQPTSAEANVALLRLSHFSQGGPPGPVLPIDIERFLGPSARIKSAKEVSLASMHVIDANADSSSVVVPRMAMRSFLLELAPPSVSQTRRELSQSIALATHGRLPPPVQRPVPAPFHVSAPQLQPPVRAGENQGQKQLQEQQQRQLGELERQLQDRERAEAELLRRIHEQQVLQGEKEGEIRRRNDQRQWDVPGEQHQPVQLQPLAGFLPKALQPAPPRIVVRPMERLSAPVWTYVFMFFIVIIVVVAWMCKLLCCGTPKPSRFARSKPKRQIV